MGLVCNLIVQGLFTFRSLCFYTEIMSLPERGCCHIGIVISTSSVQEYCIIGHTHSGVWTNYFPYYSKKIGIFGHEVTIWILALRTHFEKNMK